MSANLTRCRVESSQVVLAFPLTLNCGALTENTIHDAWVFFSSFPSVPSRVQYRFGVERKLKSNLFALRFPSSTLVLLLNRTFTQRDHGMDTEPWLPIPVRPTRTPWPKLAQYISENMEFTTHEFQLAGCASFLVHTAGSR